MVRFHGSGKERLSATVSSSRWAPAGSKSSSSTPSCAKTRPIEIAHQISRLAMMMLAIFPLPQTEKPYDRWVLSYPYMSYHLHFLFLILAGWVN